MKKLFISILLLISSFCISFGQEHSAGGVVIDASTNKPLEYIPVYIKNTASGCLTNYDGEFFVKDSSGADTLVVEAIGYEKLFIKLKKTSEFNMKIMLKPENIQLTGAVVKPKRERYIKKGNPAIELIRNVIAHKDSNRIESRDHYKCDLYEKLTLSLDDYTPNFEKKKKLNYLKEYIDTSEITGKPILTVSIRETMNDYFYRKSPKEKKTVRKAMRHTGLDKEFDHNGGLTSSLELLFTGANIFDDEVAFMMNRFVSPISSTLAIAYYKYYIMGTVMIDGVQCTDLSFVPYNSQSYGFTGRLYITTDGNYSIKKVQLNFPSKSNVNWIDKLRIDQEFNRLEDGSWAMTKEDSYVNLAVFEGTQGVFAHQSRHFSNYTTDNELLVDNPAFRIDGPLETLPDAKLHDEKYWAANRPIVLNKREANIKRVSEEISEKSSAVVWMKILDAFVSEYVPTSSEKSKSKFDFGPILSFVGYNYIEQLRLRVGGMTTANLSKRWFGSGYIAYGTHDEKIKGSVTLTHSFRERHHHPYENPLNNISATYSYDIYSPEVIGEQHDLVTSLKAGTVKKLQYIRKMNVKYDKHWLNSLSTSLWIENSKYTPATTADQGTLRYEFMPSLDGESINIPNITTTELGARVRWAPGEKVLNMVSQRANFDKDTPIFTLTHTLGIKGLFGGQYNYNRTEFNVFNRFHLSFAGFLDARISAGKVWNTVPWPLLIMPAANQSFAYRRETFHMMNALEFVNDQYAQINLTWHMKGMIFNRIPLIKKLKLREVVIFNGLYGNLTDKNNPELTPGLFKLPEGTSAMGKMPYMEMGVGIENVAQLFRIVYFYRLTYQDNIQSWIGKWGGLRFGVYVDF